MVIDFSKFNQMADVIRQKIEFALSDDGKISENEIRQMNLDKETERILRQELRMNTDIYDGNIVITQKEGDATYTLKLDKGKKEGPLVLTKDSLEYYARKYPDADIKGAYLHNGTIYLTNSNGKMALDANMNPITYSFSKNNESPKLNFVEFYLAHNGTFDIKQLTALQAMQDKINSQPAVTESYLELMNSIKFEQADDEEKTKMLFTQAKENLVKSASTEDVLSNLFTCLMLDCQVKDYDIGIPELREHFNKFLCLDKIAEKARNWANDGDESHLSSIEKIVSGSIGTIKGAETFMTSTQLLAFAAIISAAAVSAEAAGAGELFGAATTLYFGYETGKTGLDGLKGLSNAENQKEAEEAGKMLGTAAMMLLGVAKGGKHVAQKIKTNKTYSELKQMLDTATNEEKLIEAGESLQQVKLTPEQSLELNTILYKKALKVYTEKAPKKELNEQVRFEEDVDVVRSETGNGSSQQIETLGDFYNLLQELGAQAKVYINNNKRAVLVETGGKPPKYDIWEFDENNNFTGKTEGKTIDDFKTEYPDFASQKPKKCGSNSGTVGMNNFGFSPSRMQEIKAYNEYKQRLISESKIDMTQLSKHFKTDMKQFIKDNLNDIFEVTNISNDGWMEVKTLVHDSGRNKNYEYTFILRNDEYVYVLEKDLSNSNKFINKRALVIDTNNNTTRDIHPDRFDSLREMLKHSRTKDVRTTDPFKSVENDLIRSKETEKTGDLFPELAESISELKDNNFKTKTEQMKNKFLSDQRGGLFEALKDLAKTLNGIDPISDKLAYDKINEILNAISDLSDTRTSDLKIQQLFKQAQEISDIVNTSKGNYALKDTKHFVQDIKTYLSNVYDTVKQEDKIFALLGKEYEILDYSNDYVKVKVNTGTGTEEHVFTTEGEHIACKYEHDERHLISSGNYKVVKKVSYSSLGEEYWNTLQERIQYSKKHPHSARPYEPFNSEKYKEMEQKFINDEKFVSLKNTLAMSDSLSLAEKKAFYKQYYLDILDKDASIPKEVIASLERIYETYKIPVFLDKNIEPECAFLIENELSSWTKVSKGKAKFPTIIDTSTINPQYYHTGVQGYVGMKNENMSLNGSFGVVIAMRHELTHLNDGVTKCFGWFGENSQYDFRENGSILKNKQWYRKELENAGIEDCFIDYAYKDKLEFIAVASQGNLKSYSAEFKQVLIELGMPEWMFELPC